VDVGSGLSQDGKIIMVSLIVFVVSSSLFFVIGFLCGHIYRKESKTCVHETVPESPVTVLEIRRTHTIQQELDLETNVAYGSVPRGVL
jgi:hypothetical protein